MWVLPLDTAERRRERTHLNRKEPPCLGLRGAKAAPRWLERREGQILIYSTLASHKVLLASDFSLMVILYPGGLSQKNTLIIHIWWIDLCGWGAPRKINNFATDSKEISAHFCANALFFFSNHKPYCFIFFPNSLLSSWFTLSQSAGSRSARPQLFTSREPCWSKWGVKMAEGSLIVLHLSELILKPSTCQSKTNLCSETSVSPWEAPVCILKDGTVREAKVKD